MKTIRIGCGVSFATDRIDPAAELAEKGELHYLGFPLIEVSSDGKTVEVKVSEERAAEIEARERDRMPLIV